MKKLTFIVLSAFALCTLPAAAQIEDYDISEDEIPFGLLEEAEEDESYNYIEKNYLSPLDEDVELDDKNPFFPDEYFIERLKAIPGPEEFQVFNSVVKSYIDRYATRLRRSVSSMIGRYNLYADMFDDILARYDVPEVLNYLPVIESAINPKARSHAGASGLWQFMPSTGKMYGLEINSWVDERNDPYRSTEAAARYLRKLYDTYGDWSLVLAAYNCGPGNVNKAIQRTGGARDYWTIYPHLPRETRGYVPAFIAASYIMNNYSQHNIKARTATKPIILDTAVVHYDLKMEQIARACDIDLEEIKGFNPQYKSTFIPGGRRRCTIALPQELCYKFVGIEDSIYRKTVTPTTIVTEEGDTTTVAPETQEYTEETIQEPVPVVSQNTSYSSRRESYSRDNNRHSRNKSDNRSSKRDRKSRKSASKEITIKDGDNLSKIAARNHTTVAELKKKNGLKSDRIRAGQTLKVK